MLSINISEMVLTILNFLLLLFLLNRLLFKPLVSFMDQRQSRIDALLAKRQAAEAALEREELLCQDGAETARKEAQRLVEEAELERERRHAQLVERCNQQEQERHRELEEDMAQLETREAAEIADAEDDLARLLARRLLSGKL